MSLFPSSRQPTFTIIPSSPEALAGSMGNASMTAAAWPTANRAMFYPFKIYTPITVRSLFVVNGVPSGNLDLGVYSQDGTLLIHTGAKANVGTNSMQVISVPPTFLFSGGYYMGMVMDNTTATIFRRNLATGAARGMGLLAQSSAFPLPEQAAFIAAISSIVPYFGLSTRSFG